MPTQRTLPRLIAVAERISTSRAAVWLAERLPRAWRLSYELSRGFLPFTSISKIQGPGAHAVAWVNKRQGTERLRSRHFRSLSFDSVTQNCGGDKQIHECSAAPKQSCPKLHPGGVCRLENTYRLITARRLFLHRWLRNSTFNTGGR